MCTVNGNLLVWKTSITIGAVAAFTSTANVGTIESNSGFTAVLTERANGMSISTLTFNPSIVRPNGSGGVNVTCVGDSANTTKLNIIAVTSAGNVVYRVVVVYTIFLYRCSWCTCVWTTCCVL